MHLSPELYKLEDAERLMTPALLIYPELVERNVQATLKMVGGDASRWRPHIKTAKLLSIIQLLIRSGVRAFKCATTLELLTACSAGADDVLVAIALSGANARRVAEIAAAHPRKRVSVLIEAVEQLSVWRNSSVGIYIDVNPGMDRTGISERRTEEILRLARAAGRTFRGLHYYDGHASNMPASEREAGTHAGYDRLLAVVRFLDASGVTLEEVITSGTPATPYGLSYKPFQGNSFVHRVSPGTVVYNDTTSLEQLPAFGYVPAVAVLATVISHPRPNVATCDAGHKSVSVDAGVPNCQVAGWPHLKPLKPSEEHLPIESVSDGLLPGLGEKLYLIPRHVCPTVNNFDQAIFVRDGVVQSLEPVTARGHESPLVMAEQALSV